MQDAKLLSAVRYAAVTLRPPRPNAVRHSRSRGDESLSTLEVISQDSGASSPVGLGEDLTQYSESVSTADLRYLSTQTRWRRCILRARNSLDPAVVMVRSRCEEDLGRTYSFQ